MITETLQKNKLLAKSTKQAEKIKKMALLYITCQQNYLNYNFKENFKTGLDVVIQFVRKFQTVMTQSC